MEISTRDFDCTVQTILVQFRLIDSGSVQFYVICPNSDGRSDIFEFFSGEQVLVLVENFPYSSFSSDESSQAFFRIHILQIRLQLIPLLPSNSLGEEIEKSRQS